MMLSICSEIDLPFNVLNLMLNKNSRKNNLSFSGPVTKALPSIPPLSGFFASSLRMTNKTYVWFLFSRSNLGHCDIHINDFKKVFFPH